MTITAKIIADSISQEGIRLTTMQITFPRFILAEFNTHRVFSRNFRSSRAVPVAKLIEEVRTSPYEPLVWLKNKPGMQGGEEMTSEEIEVARTVWRQGAVDAADRAEALSEIGLHKQWANRGLEPYLYVHGVVTSTDWCNFFALRDHKDAQPEIRELARAMKAVMDASKPQGLNPGGWHLPYVEVSDWEARGCHPNLDYDEWIITPLRKVSAARCARVSYMTHEGKRPSIEADLKLYDQLMGGEIVHASPTEHQATPDETNLGGVWMYPEQHGNLRGWIQHRKMIPNEATREAA